MSEKGALIKDRFRVIRILGQGGMGDVFEVDDELLHRRLALKTLRDEFRDADFRARFLHEGRALAALQHPNILAIFDVFEDGDGLYLLMPLVEGRNLVDLIAKGPVPLAETARIIRAVAEALDYAHQRGVIHRDIKPSNILVEASGHVVLMDFGIAKVQGEQDRTQPGSIVGTLNYLSPEAILGKPIDHRADVYALGVTAFQMLSGKLPFAFDGDYEFMSATVTQQPPRITSLRPDVPSETAEALMVALAKDPNQRFSSAGAFAQAAFPADIERAPVMPASVAAPRKERAFGRALAQLANLLKGLREPSNVKVNAEPTSEVPAQKAEQDSTVVLPAPSTQLLRSDSPKPTQTFGPAVTASTPLEDARASEQGEFTRVFQTLGESTVREIGSSPPLPGKASASEASRPRVSLSFTASADPVLTGTSVPVTKVPFLIGRSGDADLSIPSEPALSRQQCSIDWDGRGYILRDLGSRNSTWLNGRAVPTGGEVLLFGSVIRFSSSTALTFVSLEAAGLPDLTGCLIDQRFKLVSLIRGSSKTALYKAEDSRLPRNVAIKILSPALASYPGYLEQFNREAEMAARLRHLHIAKVLDFGPVTLKIAANDKFEAHYVCMEYMQGGSLGKRISEANFLKASDAAGWLIPIADALDYAHRNGIVHSGLKSNSIIFDDEGKPYLTDFAIATNPTDANRRVFLGTPEFMAPEQWEGLEPTQATDQYSLAVLVYYALTGIRPYEGQQDPNTRKRNFGREVTPVHLEAHRQGNADVPETVSPVVARGMAVNSADRYASVREFSAAFQAALAAGPRRPVETQVFLSYRRDEAAGWAALFSRELQARGISVFVDMQRRDNAVRFPAWLEKAIRECDIFMCLLSSKTLESAWVCEEVRLAHQYGKPMIPILQEDFKFPDTTEKLEPHLDTLLTYQGIQLLDRKGVYFDATIADLAKMIQATSRMPQAGAEKLRKDADVQNKSGN